MPAAPFNSHIYQNSTPFVLGTSPSRPTTGLHAILSATARALKALSARWWSFSPRRQSTCIVMPAPCAKDCRQCGNISQLRSPIFSRLRPRSMTEYGRFDRSTTARDRASSRGQYAYPKRAKPDVVCKADLKAYIIYQLVCISIISKEIIPVLMQ